jgi:hypothetical protein
MNMPAFGDDIHKSNSISMSEIGCPHFICYESQCHFFFFEKQCHILIGHKQPQVLSTPAAFKESWIL